LGRSAQLIIGCMLALAGAALAQPASSPPRSPEMQQRIAQSKERLHLTPEQEPRLRALLEGEAQKLRAIRAKYGSDDSAHSRAEQRREARVVQQDFRVKLAEVLSPEQIAEWDKIASERRAQARERRHQQH
jgi:Spy/CpxP family protein refolding chaperone